MTRDIEIQLIDCNETDIDVILKLSRETFLAAFGDVNTEANMNEYLASAFNKERITGELRNPNVQYFLLHLNNKPRGYLKVNEGESQNDLKDKEGLEIERVYIIKEYQGRGLGKILMNKALEIGSVKKKEYVWLGVWEKNLDAIRFYEQIGFEKFGTHDFYMGDDRQMDYLLRMELGKKT